MRPPRIAPEFRSWTLHDGYVSRGRLWPPRMPKPQVGFLYLHGIQSHGGWYEWSASMLAESGGPVILPDRRGSGLNDAARGDAATMQQWLTDVDDHADCLAREFGIERFGVLGVSWGGKLATAWALRHPERVARVLLIAPGLFPTVDLRFADKLRVGISVLRGGLRCFEVPLSDPALFTANPAGRRFIADDPLKLSQVTARFLYSSRRLDKFLRRASAGALQPPLTLLLAGRDAIIRNRETVQWAQRIAAETPQIVDFPDGAHTLEFEPDVARLADVLRGWAGTHFQTVNASQTARQCNRTLP